MSDIVISWDPHGYAVSYIVDIEHQVTHETDSQSTTNTTVTFQNKPTGTYDYKVTAVMPDETTQIIVEDVLEN